MIILTWNVRGLGHPAKRHLVKDFISSCKVDLVCLQESKLQEIHSSVWRSIGGSRFDSFNFLPAIGTAGGIIIAWDSTLLTGTLVHKGTFSLSISFLNKIDHSSFLCTSVYGPNARSQKAEFWSELHNIRLLSTLPWVLGGDFNATFSIQDKNKGLPNLDDIACSTNFIQDLDLFEPPLSGRGYTWTNDQTDPLWVRLDHFLLSHI